MEKMQFLLPHSHGCFDSSFKGRSREVGAERERGGERCSAVWKSGASGQSPPDICPDQVLCSITTKSTTGMCPVLRVYVKRKVILVSSYFLN